MPDLDTESVVDTLNEILEQELAGVVRYTHYSFLIFVHNRIPIVSWLRQQATESLLHAQQQVSGSRRWARIRPWRPDHSSFAHL